MASIAIMIEAQFSMPAAFTGGNYLLNTLQVTVVRLR